MGDMDFFLDFQRLSLQHLCLPSMQALEGPESQSCVNQIFTSCVSFLSSGIHKANSVGTNTQHELLQMHRTNHVQLSVICLTRCLACYC